MTAVLAGAGGTVGRADWIERFDGPTPTVRVSADVPLRDVRVARLSAGGRTGDGRIGDGHGGGERLVGRCDRPTRIVLAQAIPPLTPVAELTATAAVTVPADAVRVGLLVTLPRSRDEAGRVLRLPVWSEPRPAERAGGAVVLSDVPRRLARAVTAYRADERFRRRSAAGTAEIDADGAYADRLLVDFDVPAGPWAATWHELRLTGVVPTDPAAAVPPERRDDGRLPGGGPAPAGGGGTSSGLGSGESLPPVTLRLDRIERAERPIFVRAVTYRGERWELLAELGFTVAVLDRPADAATASRRPAVRVGTDRTAAGPARS